MTNSTATFAPPAIALETWRELSQFEQFALTLTSSLQMTEPDATAVTTEQLEAALESIGTAFGADECTFVTYDAHGKVSLAGSWAAPPHQPCTPADLDDMPWLLQRVVRGVVVAITSDSGYPQSAAADRAHALRTGSVARLVVPLVLGQSGRAAMMIAARRRHPDWNDAAAGRLRLVGEIVASATDRTLPPEEPHPIAPTRQSQPHYDNGHIIGASPAITTALARLNEVAPLDVTVLLCGETGTG